MAKTMTIPKLTPEEAKQIQVAAENAYNNRAADEFLDEVMKSAEHYQQFFSDEQSRSE